MTIRANRPSKYESKCVTRFRGLAESRGIIVHSTRLGTLEGSRCVCVMIEPGIPAGKVQALAQDAQKCFRRAVVRLGHGATKPYNPEIVYPTIYLMFSNGANHD